MLLHVRAEVKHCLTKPQTAGMKLMLHRGWKLPLKQRLRLPLPQPGLHHEITHFREGDEESHGLFVNVDSCLFERCFNKVGELFPAHPSFIRKMQCPFENAPLGFEFR